MGDIILNCYHIFIEKESDDNMFYIIWTAILTVIGSAIISLLNSYLSKRDTQKRDLKIIGSDIFALTHKCLRTFLACHISAFDEIDSYYKISMDTNSDFYKEQFHQNKIRCDNFVEKWEENRSELQKHVNLYLAYCKEGEIGIIFEKMQIINAVVVKDYEEDLKEIYKNNTNIENLQQAIAKERLNITKFIDDSEAGKSMTFLINYFYKNVRTKA
jgi:hypothetical protein